MVSVINRVHRVLITCFLLLFDPQALEPVRGKEHKVPRFVGAEFRGEHLGKVPSQEPHPNSIDNHHVEAVLKRDSIHIRHIPCLRGDSHPGTFVFCECLRAEGERTGRVQHSRQDLTVGGVALLIWAVMSCHVIQVSHDKGEGWV